MAKAKEYKATKVLIHKGETIAIGEPVKGLSADQVKRLKEIEAIEEASASTEDSAADGNSSEDNK
jgi:hypothetical protein